MKQIKVHRAIRLRRLNAACQWIDEKVLRHRLYSVCQWVSSDWWGWEFDHWEDSSEAD